MISVRFGPAGEEKPGLVDADRRVRDLSGLVADIAGEMLMPAGLRSLPELTPRRCR
jgi:ureidoglycolate lyase